MSSTLLIYGANGYTGTLIAKLAAQKGLEPILAARNPDKVEPLARELSLEYRTFSLDDEAAIDEALADVTVVLHCAGSFSRTSKPMVDGCLRTKTHYLDITGEVAVFEAIANRDSEAKAAGIMLLPGVGFDVVPSDCLAAHLKSRMPDATQLSLAFQILGGVSRGTATTVVENQNKGGLIRQNGIITPVPAAWKTRTVDFGQGLVEATTVPWGDVSTAYYSTGIPNIELYAAFSPSQRKAIVLSRYIGWLLALPPVQQFLKYQIQKQAPGPNDLERTKGQSFLWGEVANNAGDKLVSRLQCPEAYTLTAITALTIARKVLAGQVAFGFHTPSQVYGADLILEIEGVTRKD